MRKRWKQFFDEHGASILWQTLQQAKHALYFNFTEVTTTVSIVNTPIFYSTK